MVYQNSTNHYQISKYIVDPTATDSPYTTIQSALTAANTAGGNTNIIVRAGTYNENLTLYDNINLTGSGDGCTINGQHTPPDTGSLVISNFVLTGSPDIFNSNAVGDTNITISNCITGTIDGYVFNLPNWSGLPYFTGFLKILNTITLGLEEGVIINSGGATLLVMNSTVGYGSTNPSTITGNGLAFFYSSVIGNPFTFGGTISVSISNGSSSLASITTSDTAYVGIYNSSVITGVSQAIIHNSGTAMDLSNVTIDSSNGTPVDGSGTINLGSITFLDEDTIAATLTLNRTPYLDAGILRSAQSYHMYAAAGNVIDIVPDGAIAGVTWSGINIDGSALDPSAGSAVVNGIMMDLSGVDQSNDPYLVGLDIEMPTTFSGTEEKAAAYVKGFGYEIELCSGDHEHALVARGPCQLDYDATTLAAGESMSGFFISVDEVGSTGGELHGLQVNSTNSGSATVVAVGTSEGVEVIHQHIGTFGNVTQGWIYSGGYTDSTVAFNNAGTDLNIFVNDNDYIYIGSNAAFSTIQVILDTEATVSILPVFEYSIAGPGWTAFSPSDGTNGFSQNGLISFDSADLAGWASVNVNGSAAFYIRIQRTRNVLVTNPIEDTIQIAQPTLYFWDDTGDLEFASGSVVAGDFDITRDTSGAGTVLCTIANTDNTAFASNASQLISVGGTTSTGDPFTKWLITGSTTFSAGIDNSDADAFKIGPNADPSTGTSSLEISTGGAVTFAEAYTMPTADGTISGQVMITNASGTVSWTLQTMVQEVYATSSALITCTTVMPNDDTIPQNTEGDEVLTATITPKSATNILVIEFSTSGSVAQIQTVPMALFQDTTVNALAAAYCGTITAAGYTANFSLRHAMVSGTTSSTTFKIRVGVQTGGDTVYLNGVGGARKFGGVASTILTIKEYKP